MPHSLVTRGEDLLFPSRGGDCVDLDIATGIGGIDDPSAVGRPSGKVLVRHRYGELTFLAAGKIK